jgi:hypothetical protein
MYDEAHILYSSTNSISLKLPKHIGFIGFDKTYIPCILLNVQGIVNNVSIYFVSLWQTGIRL